MDFFYPLIIHFKSVITMGVKAPGKLGSEVILRLLGSLGVK
jgi:hypothetical protein